MISSATPEREGWAYAIRHHTALTSALEIELRRPPPDSAFRHFYQQVDVASICAAICDWTIAQIQDGAWDLDQLVCDGNTMRGSIQPISSGGSSFIAHVTLYAASERGT